MPNQNNALPDEDKTPDDFVISLDGKTEYIRQFIRRFLYPVYNKLTTYYYKRKITYKSFSPDYYLRGQRGNDYPRLRKRVNNIIDIQGKTVLIAGCGTGRDIVSWAGFHPAKIIAVDYFNYNKAWASASESINSQYPDVEIVFQQGDLTNLSTVDSESIDIVGSDAVFEHLTDLDSAASEFHRILKPGGVMYATFGPLWLAWGGDHISGYDDIDNGYNHLVLNKDEYNDYIDAAGSYSHSEHDGRTWIENAMFSYLNPDEYVNIIERHDFNKRVTGVIIDPRAFMALKNKINSDLMNRYPVAYLVTSGMTVIYQRAVY